MELVQVRPELLCSFAGGEARPGPIVGRAGQPRCQFPQMAGMPHITVVMVGLQRQAGTWLKPYLGIDVQRTA